MAAVLAARPAVASHLSAGWLWGLLRNRPGTIHVTVPTPRRAKRPFVVHFADLPGRDRWVLEDIPVTSLARTLLDLAAMLSPPQLERALERAEELGLFDLVALEDVLDRAGRHPGVVDAAAGTRPLSREPRGPRLRALQARAAFSAAREEGRAAGCRR